MLFNKAIHPLRHIQLPCQVKEAGTAGGMQDSLFNSLLYLCHNIRGNILHPMGALRVFCNLLHQLGFSRRTCPEFAGHPDILAGK